MKYYEFLVYFLLPPIFLLIGYFFLKNSSTRIDHQRELSFRFWQSIALVSFVAVIYTTPWDNYLVANRVWWYDPALVTGIVLAWVPVEEYIFFVLQTFFTGALTLTLDNLKSLRRDESKATSDKLRWTSGWIAVLILTTAITGFFLHWDKGTYLLLLFVWALPPIALQLFFGADILWVNRRTVTAAILASTIYLSIADSLAISSGTWTINPEKSLGLIIGELPLEEIFFFIVTNTMIVFAITLINSRESQRRIRLLLENLRRSS